MIRRYAESASRKVNRTEEVFEAAAAGDGDAVPVIESAARTMGENTAPLVNLLDPATVVLGGGFGLATGPCQ